MFFEFFFFVRKCFYYLRWLCFCFVWFIIMVVFRCCILVFVIFNVGVFGKFGINVGWVLLFWEDFMWCGILWIIIVYIFFIFESFIFVNDVILIMFLIFIYICKVVLGFCYGYFRYWYVLFVYVVDCVVVIRRWFFVCRFFVVFEIIGWV